MLLSTIVHINILNSNKIVIGTPSIICVTTSGGVIIAAMINIININTPWLFFKKAGFKMPSSDNKNATTGNSNTTPKHNNIVLQKEIKLLIDTAAVTVSKLILIKKSKVMGSAT